jgi:hypothetical protein
MTKLSGMGALSEILDPAERRNKWEARLVTKCAVKFLPRGHGCRLASLRIRGRQFATAEENFQFRMQLSLTANVYHFGGGVPLMFFHAKDSAAILTRRVS